MTAPSSSDFFDCCLSHAKKLNQKGLSTETVEKGGQWSRIAGSGPVDIGSNPVGAIFRKS